MDVVILDKFEVKTTKTGKYLITGTKGYRVILNNRYDAIKHCNYLNKQEHELELFRNQNIEYYTTLTKIKMVTDQIHAECGELHILELAIRIKKLIRDALP